MNKPVAILDACVLYPAPLRDVLLSLASAKEAVYKARWTEMILEEWTRNVLERRTDITREQLERTTRLMNMAVPDGNVTDFEGLIRSLSLPDANDRHVLAAAITGTADYIVTFNAKDFPQVLLTPHGIECVGPDVFIDTLLTAHPAKVVDALQKMRLRLNKPPKTTAEFLATLAQQGLAKTVDHLNSYIDQL